MGQHDTLVRIAGRTVDPGGQGAGGRRGPENLLVGRGGSVVREHHGFQ